MRCHGGRRPQSNGHWVQQMSGTGVTLLWAKGVMGRKAETISLCSCPQLLPPTVGPVPDPAATPAVVAVEPAFPAPHLQARGGLLGPALPATGLPLSSELQSPARILAFHQELRRSLSSHVQGSAPPLEV